MIKLKFVIESNAVLIVIILLSDHSLSHEKLSDLKLSDYMIGSKLVENTWSFKLITFLESVTCMINRLKLWTTSPVCQQILLKFPKKKPYSGRTSENARNFLSGLFVQVTHTKNSMFLYFFFLFGMAWLDFLSLQEEGREFAIYHAVVPGLIFGLVRLGLNSLALHHSVRVSLWPLC